MVHVLQDGNGGQEIFELLSLLLRSFLDDGVERFSVEREQRGVLIGSNSGGTGSIVQQGKLAENFTVIVRFEHLTRTLNNLGASQLARLMNVEHIAGFTLGDDGLAGRALAHIHGLDDDIEVLVVQVDEHKTVFDALADGGSSLLALGYYLCLESLLLVPSTEDLGTY